MGIPPWRILSSFSLFLNKCLFTLLKKGGEDYLGFGDVLAYHTQTVERLGQDTSVSQRHKLDRVMRTCNLDGVTSSCNPSSREVGEGESQLLDYSWLQNQLKLETSLGYK